MRRTGLWCAVACLLNIVGLLNVSSVRADEPRLAAPIEKGQRIVTTGHSFHMPVMNALREIAKEAKIENHDQAVMQGLGGSRTIQHWDLPDDKNKAKQALKDGGVDVFTVSPHLAIPDEGIENFTRLGLEANKNPNLRVLVQESWMLFDGAKEARAFKNEDRRDRPLDGLRAAQDDWLKKLNDQVRSLNEALAKEGVSRPVVFLVPVGEAVYLLRQKIAKGEAVGIQYHDELFTDPIGHAKAPVIVLAAYCQFATIYRRTPVGLPVPPSLKRAVAADQAEALNTQLQELAWQAVIEHPLSGVTAAPAK